jgi:hypothetical protein
MNDFYEVLLRVMVFNSSRRGVDAWGVMNFWIMIQKIEAGIEG